MSTRARPTGSEPEFRWVIGGRRTRLSLVRRLSLTFEVRRAEGQRRCELWIHAEDSIRRWAVPTNGRGDLLARGRLAPAFAPLGPAEIDDDAPPRWDHGHCVIEAAGFSRFEEAVRAGGVTFSLNGKRSGGTFRLERTPMRVDGRDQWLIWREDDDQTARRRD